MSIVLMHPKVPIRTGQLLYKSLVTLVKAISEKRQK